MKNITTLIKKEYGDNVIIKFSETKNEEAENNMMDLLIKSYEERMEKTRKKAKEDEKIL